MEIKTKKEIAEMGNHLNGIVFLGSRYDFDEQSNDVEDVVSILNSMEIARCKPTEIFKTENNDYVFVWGVESLFLPDLCKMVEILNSIRINGTVTKRYDTLFSFKKWLT